jgi:hypothetical protein
MGPESCSAIRSAHSRPIAASFRGFLPCTSVGFRPHGGPMNSFVCKTVTGKRETVEGRTPVGIKAIRRVSFRPPHARTPIHRLQQVYKDNASVF